MDSGPPESNAATAEAELAAIEARLTALELEKQSLFERKRQLVAAKQVNDQTMSPIEVPVSTGDKIELFRSLFRGREDIFAVRWESSQGRRGYAWPATMSGARGSVTNRKSSVETVAIRLSCPWMIARSTRICPVRKRSDCIPYCATITPGCWPWILTRVIGNSQYRPSEMSVKSMPYLVQWSVPVPSIGNINRLLRVDTHLLLSAGLADLSKFPGY